MPTSSAPISAAPSGRWRRCAGHAPRPDRRGRGPARRAHRRVDPTLDPTVEGAAHERDHPADRRQGPAPPPATPAYRTASIRSPASWRARLRRPPSRTRCARPTRPPPRSPPGRRSVRASGARGSTRRPTCWTAAREEFIAADDGRDRRHRRLGRFQRHLAAGMLREAAAMTTQISGEVIPPTCRAISPWRSASRSASCSASRRGTRR